MKDKVNLIVSIVLIILIVVGYVMTVLALPIAEFVLIPGVVGGLAWILVIRPYLLKKKK